MYVLVQGVYVDPKIFKTKFACDYDKCGGVCCWHECDSVLGGELQFSEAIELRRKKVRINRFVPEALKEAHRTLGLTKMEDIYYTPILTGRCVYSDSKNKTCCLKTAHAAGVVSFGIPLHCELYPITMEKNKGNTFLELPGIWDEFCQDAFAKGEKENIPVYEWCKTAIVRHFGIGFYEELVRTKELL